MKIRPSGADEPKTLLSRFGFQDADLKTPQHDEMVLWVDEHADEIVRLVVKTVPARAVRDQAWAEWWRMGKTAYRLPNASAEEWREERTRQFLRVMPNEIVPKAIAEALRKPPIITRTWELPVLDGRYTVGFVDVQIVARFRVLCWQQSGQGPPTWGTYEDTVRIAVEVKSSIPSLGELVRQIRFYQSYVKDTEFVVVCPDDRFAEPLAKQGIAFKKYPGPDGLQEPAEEWMEAAIADGVEP